MCTVSGGCSHHARVKLEGRIVTSFKWKLNINWCMDDSPAQAMENCLLQLVLHGIELIIETVLECVAVCVLAVM